MLLFSETHAEIPEKMHYNWRKSNNNFKKKKQITESACA